MSASYTPDLGKLCQGIINTRSEIEQIDLALELVRQLRRFAMASVDNALADAEGSLEDSAEDEAMEAAGNAAAFYADWRNDCDANDRLGA